MFTNKCLQINFTKKWDQRRPLFLQQNKKITPFFTPFPFPIIPGNNNVAFPFPKVGNGIFHSHSRSRKLGIIFFVPVPESWESYFSFPFSFPKFGNGLSNSCSRSQSLKVIPTHPWEISNSTQAIHL